MRFYTHLSLKNLTPDSTSDLNINNTILHDIIQNAKTKHMPYKTVKLKKTQGQEILMDNTRYPPINPIQG